MKKFFLLMAGVLCFGLSMYLCDTGSHPAQAITDSGGFVFGNISAASAAVKTSSAYNVQGYRYKTLQVSGVKLTSSQASPTFKNMSGTLVAQCGPTSSGPWSTCTTSATTSTVTASFTSNGLISWQDASPYVRLQWTSATSGQKIKAWMNWQ